MLRTAPQQPCLWSEGIDNMGQGQSRNLFEAAASDELERARYFIEHDRTDVNATDKVWPLAASDKLFLDTELPTPVARPGSAEVVWA